MNQTFRTLNDKMKIPMLGFGTWQIPDDEAPQIIEMALSAGYRLIDTAAVYGNEAGVGRGLAESDIPRSEISLTTKVWNSDHGYDATLRAFEASLKRLKTDYVDLYLIHWPAPKQDKFVATWKALARLQKEGLARSIGVSNFNPEHLERIITETGIIPAVNQIELHPHFQQQELQRVHAHYGIATEAWSPLSRGKCFDDEQIQKMAAKYKKTPAQIILRWHLDNQIIAIPKSVTPKRVLENIDIFDFQLEATDMHNLLKLDDPDGRTGPDPLTASF